MPAKIIENSNRDEQEAAYRLASKLYPEWWMEKYCGWGMWEKQQAIARAVVYNERVAVPASFGVGKTYIAARLALWFLNNFSPARVITTAPTARQVRDLLWAELRGAFKHSRNQLPGKLLQTSLTIADGWDAIGFATKDEDIDKFTGYHAPNVFVVFDQACGIQPVMWRAAEGLMTSGFVRWLAISNTTDSQSEFANVCLPDRKSDLGDWHVERITAWDTPNIQAGRDIIPGLIAHDWIERKKQTWNPSDPLWQIFVEAEFVEADAMLVLDTTMQRALMSVELKPDFNDIEIGLDIADQGADGSVWTVRAGPRLLFVDKVTGNNPSQVAKGTERVWKRVVKYTGHTPYMIKLDAIGVGSGVASILEEKGYPVERVIVSEGAMDTEQFANKRAELAWGVRNLAEQNAISLVPLYHTPSEYMSSLEQELGMRYKFSEGHGRIQLESKVNVKKRIGRSPDFWDSLMFTFGETSSIPNVGLVDVAAEEEHGRHSHDREFGGITDRERRILSGALVPDDAFDDFEEDD